MIDNWIKQDEKSVFDFISNGSTVLIKFKDNWNGITIDCGATIDISWIRSDGKIIATGGEYRADEIKEWVVV